MHTCRSCHCAGLHSRHLGHREVCSGTGAEPAFAEAEAAVAAVLVGEDAS